MSFYLRKCIRVGPFRFNLSKSGIGVSTGIRGLRVGMGPRGNYVHMGANGFYYRKTFSPNGQKSVDNYPERDPPNYSLPRSEVVMKEIESGDVAQMAHSSSAELLSELEEKEKAIRFVPLISVISVVIALLLVVKGASAPQLVFWAAFSALAIWIASVVDGIRKTVVLFYDFDADLEQAYGLLHDHAVNLANCGGVWHISASGKVHDRKYHAGASNLVERKRTRIERRSPNFVKTNVETVAIEVGRQTMYLFPDRVLVYDAGKVGAVGYDELNIHVAQKQFIESEAVPSDAEVIDHTWQFVNKQGGPDRRFANNRQLPICLYDELHFSSGSGLNEAIQVSRHSIGKGFGDGVQYLSHFTRNSLRQA